MRQSTTNNKPVGIASLVPGTVCSSLARLFFHLANTSENYQFSPLLNVIENTALPNAGNDCYDMATLTSGSDFRHGDSYYAY